MSTILWLAAVILFAAYGSFACRLRVLDGLHRPAQAAIVLATGTAIGGSIMFLESAVGWKWNYVTLLIPLAAIATSFRPPRTVSTSLRRWPWPALFTLILTYAVVTGRATSPDLLYFWGPKGVHFSRSANIDVQFLAAPEHLLMHSDYPPFLPLVYAFASCLTKGFSWWGAILSAVVYFVATITAFHGLAARELGESRATVYATLLAAILAFGYVHTSAAGGAEPLLILFEVIAISLLTFADDAPGSLLLASIALLGAALTKVEGAMFVVAVIVAFAITRRNLKRVLQLSTASAAGLGLWILYALQFNLLDSYRTKPVFLAHAGTVFVTMLAVAGYRAAHLPWIACITPILIWRNWSRAALPLLVALLFSAGLYFVYLHSPDPSGWITTSADRVLLTSLAALVIAAAASSPSIAE